MGASGTGGADKEWERRVGAYLARRGPAVLGEGLHSWRPLAEDVWLLEGAAGARAVAKYQLYGVFTRGEPFDLLEVEARVLGLLRGLPVPRVRALDRGDQFIFFSYCGARTFEEVGRGGGLEALAVRAMEGLLTIEARLAEHRAELAGLVAPEAAPATLGPRWSQAGAAAHRGLESLPGGDGAAPLLDCLLELLGRRPPSLGCVDYNGRNIVVGDDGALAFIEFAKIGWDWTERRLLQYTTVVDGGRAWLCPWGERLVSAYAAAGGDAAALEGHRLVFHLNALAGAVGPQREGVRAGIGDSVGEAVGGAVERLRRGTHL